MFAITKEQPIQGVWDKEIEKPAPPGYGEVQVSVTKAGICGTDHHIYMWDAWSAGRVRPPITIGHEFVGRVTEVGNDVHHISVGDRVSCESHITCGHCHQCRTGRAHICANTEIIGVDKAGCFAESINVPASNVWKVKDRIPDEHAAVFDPVGNAMHTVSTIGVTGRDVLIVGAGAIGLFAVAIARCHGARSITVQEPNNFRAELASQLGADLVLDPTDFDKMDEWRKQLSQKRPDAILEMSGHPPALHQALKDASNGADVALLGISPSAVEMDLSTDVIMRGLTLHGITGRRMFDTWYEVESFMIRSPELMDKVVTHVMPAKGYSHGFQLMDQGACGKVVLDFSDL